MVKLLMCLLGGLAMALVLLLIRQQRLELQHRNDRLHDGIKASQNTLWQQQLRVAVHTAPNAIASTVGEKRLQMVPVNPLLRRPATQPAP